MGSTSGVEFGRLLRRLRRDAELTQEQLAERAGLSARGIGDLERGKSRSPYRATVEQLADALALAPADRAALLRASRRQPAPSLIRPGALFATPPTPLIGREQEVAAVQAFLAQPERRLVTLTGPGGVGKTRLALEVVATLPPHLVEQAYVVSLAPLEDSRLVLTMVAQTLGQREISAQSAKATLLSYLRERRDLLLLDNLEHLLAAVPDIAELLAACPEVRVLATSREALHIHGEQEYPVGPLAVPEDGDVPPAQSLLRYPAIELFVQRAGGVLPDFQLSETNAAAVVGICARLDGLPLAIELAAARTKIFPPRALLRRLDRRLPMLTGGSRDLPARLRSLHDAIDWSYDLLEPAEQVLFHRLGVFAGGFTIEAVDAVCLRTGDLDLNALEGLTSLVDKSLLTVQPAPDDEHEPRFGMLETIREFAYDRLAASPEASLVYRDHACYFLELAGQARRELSGPGQTAWLERLAQEHNNLRAALEHARQSDNIELGMRLVGALWPFWLARGHFKEARTWLDAFLMHPRATSVRPATRAYALCAAGELAYEQRGTEAALALLREALDLAREVGDDAARAGALYHLGRVALGQGDYPAAERLLEDSLAAYRGLGDRPGTSAVVASQAALARYQGDFDRAATLYTDGLRLARALGDVRRVADLLARLGQLAQDQGIIDRALPLYEESLELSRLVRDTFGVADVLYRTGSAAADIADFMRAIACYEESLELYHALGNKYGIAYVLMNEGEAAVRMGALARAETLAHQSAALFEEVGDRRGSALVLVQLADVARERDHHDRALRTYAESLTMSWELNARPGVVLCLEKMARLAGARGRWARAARLSGAAAELRASMHSVIPPADRAAYERDLAVVRERLGNETFAGEVVAGRTMGLDAAVAYALASRRGNVTAGLSRG